MTAVMKVLHRRLPLLQRHPLPPRQIAMRVAKRLGIGKPRSTGAQKAMTLAAHFSYGGAMGTVYRRITRRIPPGPGSGIAFGLAVWTGSYLGLLPATGLLTPATFHRPQRNALMIAAHVVWGWSLGALTRRIDALPREKWPWDGLHARAPH
ncbi:hypothetical protein [Pendulispora albinea]|uniref:DUF1440 domain-containing protein n=1 Tax=Pendulispora albinea TaxID=2741071 RepID=A0ABZ2LPW2_9BACT